MITWMCRSSGKMFMYIGRYNCLKSVRLLQLFHGHCKLPWTASVLQRLRPEAHMKPWWFFHVHHYTYPEACNCYLRLLQYGITLNPNLAKSLFFMTYRYVVKPCWNLPITILSATCMCNMSRRFFFRSEIWAKICCGKMSYVELFLISQDQRSGFRLSQLCGHR